MLRSSWRAASRTGNPFSRLLSGPTGTIERLFLPALTVPRTLRPSAAARAPSLAARPALRRDHQPGTPQRTGLIRSGEPRPPSSTDGRRTCEQYSSCSITPSWRAPFATSASKLTMRLRSPSRTRFDGPYSDGSTGSRLASRFAMRGRETVIQIDGAGQLTFAVDVPDQFPPVASGRLLSCRPG